MKLSLWINIIGLVTFVVAGSIDFYRGNILLGILMALLAIIWIFVHKQRYQPPYQRKVDDEH